MYEKNFTLAKKYIVTDDINKLEELVRSGFDIDKKSDKENFSLMEYFIIFSQNFERPQIASFLCLTSTKKLTQKEIIFLGIMQRNMQFLASSCLPSENHSSPLTNVLSYAQWDNNTPEETKLFWQQELKKFLQLLTPIELMELGVRVGNLSLIEKCMVQYSQHIKISGYVNKRNDTLMHIASGLGYTQILQLLMKFEADIDARNQLSWTPLQFSVLYGHFNAAKLLISAGSNLTVQNSSQQTALDIAKSNKSNNMIMLLQNR